MKVAFYRTKTLDGTGEVHLFNRLVSWWLRSEYSHCEIIVDEAIQTDGTPIYTCASASGMDGGVRFKDMTLDDNRWTIITVSTASPAKVTAWFQDHQGQGYDFLGLFGFLFRPIEGQPQRWFCSEAVAASLGFDESWRFDPKTLFDVLTVKS